MEVAFNIFDSLIKQFPSIGWKLFKLQGQSYIATNDNSILKSTEYLKFWKDVLLPKMLAKTIVPIVAETELILSELEPVKIHSTKPTDFSQMVEVGNKVVIDKAPVASKIKFSKIEVSRFVQFVKWNTHDIFNFKIGLPRIIEGEIQEPVSRYNQRGEADFRFSTSKSITLVENRANLIEGFTPPIYSALVNNCELI